MEKSVQRDPDGNRIRIECGDRFPTSRREILAALGIGGASLLAGCGDGGGPDTTTTTTAMDGDGDGDGDDDTPTTTPPDGADVVEGQTLLLHTTTPPGSHTFINTGAFPSPATMGDGWAVGSEIIGATHEPGHWGLWNSEPIRRGEWHGGLIDTVEITPEEMTVQMKEDAKWSNGDDVLGRDIVPEFAAFRLFFNLKSFEEAAEQGPDLAGEAVTDIQWDGKTATFFSDGGWFGEMIEEDIWMYILDEWEWGGINYNTQIEPFNDLFDTIMGLFRDAQNGEANPRDLNEGPLIHVIVNEPFQHEDGNYWPEYYRDPENVVTSGAFTLDEIRGEDQIVLKKNPHHRHADDINYEEVVLQWREENQANWAALNTRALDYWNHELPDHVANSFGDDITQNLVPTQGGKNLTLNHDAEIFSEPEYRRGLYYALDKQALASVQNPNQFVPIQTPGGDLWDAGDWFSDEFLNSLNTYAQDTARAEEIWRSAGFTKEGGQWFLPSGDRAQLVIPTDDTAPEMEITLVSQLNDFGVDAQLLTLESATYAERQQAGEFDLYPTALPGANIGYVLYAVARSWAVTAQRGSRICRQLNWFPEEQCEQVDYLGGDGIIASATAEAFSPFSLEAPEVGDWFGPTREWQAPMMGWEAWRSPDSEQIQDLYPKLAWLVNWWLPNFPIANGYSLHLYQSAHWNWPSKDNDGWQALGGHEMNGVGDMISANPDNPRRD